MGYELRLSPQTQENITHYIRENVEAGAKTEVLDAIYAAMHSLTQGPPETRRQTRPGPLVYRFQVRASGRRAPRRVSFQGDAERGHGFPRRCSQLVAIPPSTSGTTT